MADENYTSNDFFREVFSAAHSQRVQRLGQYMFSFLVKVKPALAEAVRGTDLDPFYNNERIPVFCLFVKDNWDGFGEIL